MGLGPDQDVEQQGISGIRETAVEEESGIEGGEICDGGWVTAGEELVEEVGDGVVEIGGRGEAGACMEGIRRVGKGCLQEFGNLEMLGGE